MYKMFVRNLKNYLSSIDNTMLYRNSIIEPLIGIADRSLYTKWKEEQPDKYLKASELVYYINQSIPSFPRFETFSMDLWGLGFESKETDQLIDENIYEQLKLVDLFLAGVYL